MLYNVIQSRASENHLGQRKRHEKNLNVVCTYRYVHCRSSKSDEIAAVQLPFFGLPLVLSF